MTALSSQLALHTHTHTHGFAHLRSAPRAQVLDGRLPYIVSPPSTCAFDAAKDEGEDGSDGDSDWQVDDDYESEKEDAEYTKKVAEGDLLGVFGEERHGPGSGSIKSRKKQTKLFKKREAEKAEELWLFVRRWGP